MTRLIDALGAHKLEGIVVKRKESRYLEGREPGSWVKYRLYDVGEFVIGGYLKRKDPYFDALIVGEQKGVNLSNGRRSGSALMTRRNVSSYVC